MTPPVSKQMVTMIAGDDWRCARVGPVSLADRTNALQKGVATHDQKFIGQYFGSLGHRRGGSRPISLLLQKAPA
jgi:hypothetical protein